MTDTHFTHTGENMFTPLETTLSALASKQAVEDAQEAHEARWDADMPDWRDREAYAAMTDEALHVASMAHDAMRAESAYDSHRFYGIDGRCFDCDIRPHTALRRGTFCIR